MAIKKKSNGFAYSSGTISSATGTLIDSNTEKAKKAKKAKKKAINNGEVYSSGYNLQKATKIDPYQSQFNDKIISLANDIGNRKEFEYDFNADPLYENYKDTYTRQAMLGSENAQANAATLSGGYGNSYAATAGALAYQENMSKLNDVIPQLYEAAYNKYNQDLANQRADLQMWQGLDDSDYAKYKDTVSDTHWQDEYNATQYNNAKNYTSQEYWTKKNYGLSEKQYKQAVKEWKAEQKRNKKNDSFDHWLAKQNLKLAKKASASSGSSGGGGRRYSSSGPSKYKSTGIPAAVYNKIRKYKNGNSGQAQVAAGTLSSLQKQYKLTDSQVDYLYEKYLGYKPGAGNKVFDNKKVLDGSDNNTVKQVKIKSKKVQTREDAIKKGAPKSTASESTFITECAHGNKKFTKYRTYADYLTAMVKKGK